MLGKIFVWKIAKLESLNEKDKLSLFFQLVQILLKALLLHSLTDSPFTL